MKPYEEVAEFIAGAVDATKLAQFRPSAAAEARAGELLEKKKAGSLEQAEQVELDEFLWTEHLMILAKARSRTQAATA